MGFTQFEQRINLFTISMLLIAVGAVVALDLFQSEVGRVFNIVLIAGAIFLGIVFAVDKDGRIKSPFAKSSFQAVTLYFGIIIFLIGLLVFAPTIISQTITSVDKPLALSFVDPLLQNTPLAVSIASDQAVNFITLVFIAPFTEEFALGFIAFLAFAVIAIFISQSLNLESLGIEEDTFILIVGLIGSGAIFTLLHTLNATYAGNPSAFIFAFGFRIVMNWLIWSSITNLPLIVPIAIHTANNFISWMNSFATLPSGSIDYGLILSTFASLIVLPFTIILLVGVILWIRNFRETDDVIGDMVEDIIEG